MISNSSTKTNASIASAIGTPLMPTQGSCLPFVTTVVSLPFVSILLPGCKILDVGLKASLVIISCPVDIPPKIPPAWFVKKPCF